MVVNWLLRHPRLLDVLLVAVLIPASTLEIAPHTWGAERLGFATLASLPLLVRRWRPVPVLAVVMAATLAEESVLHRTMHLPATLAVYTVAAVATVVFAGSLPAPSTGLLASAGAWLVLSSAFWFALALGVASLVGSRSMTIGGMLAFRLAVSPILLSIGPLGAAREAVPAAAFARIAPHAVREFTQQAGPLPMSVGVAELVLLAWAAAALAVGAWRTVTRDA